MDNIRIAVLSAYDDVRAFLDNAAPEAMHYYDDELHEYLKGAASTYTFKTDAQHPESVSLVEGNKLAFKWRRKDYYFNIVRVIRDEYEVEVEAYSLNLELLNERVDAYKASKAMKFAEYLDVFDFEKVLTLNINEVADKTITHEWTGSDTVLARIYSLATVFDAEAEFVPQLNNDYSLKRIVLNVYKKHSSTDQGLGRYRQDIILRYGKEVSGITKTSDITELYTAIRPTGKDGLMVTNLNKTENDAAGNVEYQSLTGDGCIRAVQARDRFPSNTASTDRYSTVDWSYDTDNVNTLYGQALAELKKNCVPQVQYEVKGYFDTDIGDTVTIVDEVYNPPLYLQARVTEQSRSFTDPGQNKTIFDNFKELQSQIDKALLNAMQKLIAENKVYTCSVITDNGIVFKNGEGSTTLTASVMEGGADKTGQVTIQWYKDGTAVRTGVSLLVNAADISSKAVYRYEALEGTKVRGTCEVTVSNVADGAEGTGIQSITEEYYLSTSKESPSGGSWVTTPPTWSAGKYMWTRKKTVYKNPESTVYTTPLCDSSWEAVNEIEVGGRNLSEKTNQGITGWAWNMQVGDKTITEVVEDGIRCCKLLRGSIEQSGWYYISYNDIGRKKLEPGGQYLVSFEVKCSVSTRIYADFIRGNGLDRLNETRIVLNGDIVANQWSRCTFILKLKTELPATTDQVLYLSGMNSDTGVSYIFRNLKIEKGNKPTDWTPAPEDIQNQIDDAIEQLSDIASDSKLTPNEKTATKKEWLIIADEYPKYITQATGYNVSTTAYTNAYNALNSYLNTTNTGVIFNMDTTTDIVSTTFTNNFKSYYNSKVDLTNAIATAKAKYEADNVIVGVSNIFGQSGRWKTLPEAKYWANNGGGLVLDDTVKYDGYPTLKTTVGSGIRGYYDYWIEVDTDLVYTYSALIKTDTLYTSGALYPLHCHCSDNKNNNPGAGVEIISYKQDISTVNKWTLLYLTFRPKGKYWRPFVYIGASSTAVFNVAYLKLERGNKATDWTPAPEDIQEQIDDAAGIAVSDTEPTIKYTGMLWKHTGTVSGLIKNATYRWNGTTWEIYYFSAVNIDVENLSAISANLGTVTAGLIKNLENTVEFNVADGYISSSVKGAMPNYYENGKIGYPESNFSEGGVVSRLYPDKEHGALGWSDEVAVNGAGVFVNGVDLWGEINKLNRNLEYKTYTPTSVNANIGNKSIIVKANAYDCKINGFMYLNPATYDNDTVLFKTPLKPTGTIYFSTTVAGRGFKVMTDGSVRANGVYTVSAGIYVYFGVSFAIA